MKKTNKQLLNLGLTQEQLLELVQGALQVMESAEGSVSNIEMGGDEFSTDIRFTDHKDRNWVVYILDGENTDTIYANTYKGDELEEKNEKSFKSVMAVVNHIKRVVA